MIRFRPLLVLAAFAALFVLFTADAHARVGGGFSGGSRGLRTFSAPPATSTAPTASPIQRSLTSPGTTASGIGGRPGFFGGGLFGGLAAGFLGAGLFGLLFGNGLFGGMGGFASVLGLMLQIWLVVMVARLLFAWWQGHHTPAYATAHPATGHGFSGLGGMMGGHAPAGEAFAIDKSDYDAFERLLGEIQSAYSAEDLAALRAKVTPEMLSYFSEDLAKNSSRGLVNQISDVKLEQGDLAEAWREDATDYASVAMRFSLVDRMVERASGKTVEGSANPVDVTEIWTFMRAGGGNWLLSAIQQT